MEIDAKLAKRVLEVVDAGLCSGMGNPKPGEMCVEAAVCYAMDLPHGDNPSCVSPAIRQLKIMLNDANWSSNAARAKGLRRLAVLQLGSKDSFDNVEFAQRLVLLAKKYAANAAKYAEHAEYAAEHAANAAKYAEYAAEHAEYAAKYAERDKVLADFAEDVVKILIEMKAPGVQFLSLTEE